MRTIVLFLLTTLAIQSYAEPRPAEARREKKPERPTGVVDPKAPLTAEEAKRLEMKAKKEEQRRSLPGTSGVSVKGGVEQKSTVEVPTGTTKTEIGMPTLGGSSLIRKRSIEDLSPTGKSHLDSIFSTLEKAKAGKTPEEVAIIEEFKNKATASTLALFSGEPPTAAEITRHFDFYTSPARKEAASSESASTKSSESGSHTEAAAGNGGRPMAQEGNRAKWMEGLNAEEVAKVLEIEVHARENGEKGLAEFYLASFNEMPDVAVRKDYIKSLQELTKHGLTMEGAIKAAAEAVKRVGDKRAKELLTELVENKCPGSSFAKMMLAAIGGGAAGAAGATIYQQLTK